MLSGQAWYSPLAILTALTLKAVFQLALRQTEGLIGSIIDLLGLSLAVPTFSTLSRRAETVEVPRPRANKGADNGTNSEPLHLLVDSTGLKLCGPGEWLVEKHGTRARRSWRKLHIGLDAETGRIVAASLTAKEVDDGAEVGPLLDQVAGAVASFTADGGNDQDGVYASVTQRHLDAVQSCRRARPPCRATRPRPRLRGATATSSILPSTGIWRGRTRPATRGELGLRWLSLAGNR